MKILRILGNFLKNRTYLLECTKISTFLKILLQLHELRRKVKRISLEFVKVR